MPYYFNIAQNRDLTLYPRIVGRRGLQVGADLRFLSEKFTSEFGLQVLPSDIISGENLVADFCSFLIKNTDKAIDFLSKNDEFFGF